jgi:hypothetical protein
MMTEIGYGLCCIGFLCLLSAMTFGTTGPERWYVFLRGSFQRSKDYTTLGWRFYKIGLWCFLFGLVVAVVGGSLQGSF